MCDATKVASLCILFLIICIFIYGLKQKAAIWNQSRCFKKVRR